MSALAARRIKYQVVRATIPFAAAVGLAFAPIAAHAQTAVFNALTRTDYNNNTYSGPGAVDFAGTSTNGTPTAFTKGRTLMGQSFSAQNLGLNPVGQAGFEVTSLQFYLWNGNNADGGNTGVNYNNIRANVNFWGNSTGEDELSISPSAPIFSNKIGNTLVYNFTSQQVTSVNGVDGSATLITVTVPNPTLYAYTSYGDPTDDVNSINNRNRNFLGISIQLQGDAGAGFGTTNDLSIAVWDKADYRQVNTGKIAMATGNSNRGHPFGGFYRDFDVPIGDPLHQVADFSGLDERSVQGTSFNSLALGIFGRNIAAIPEPSTFALVLPFLASGGSVFIARRRKHRTAVQTA